MRGLRLGGLALVGGAGTIGGCVVGGGAVASCGRMTFDACLLFELAIANLLVGRGGLRRTVRTSAVMGGDVLMEMRTLTPHACHHVALLCVPLQCGGRCLALIRKSNSPGFVAVLEKLGVIMS